MERAERARRAGDLAEADARWRLEADGYRTFELKNESGHGPDIIAVRPGDPPQIVVVEVKANGGSLTAPQQAGGEGYLRDVLYNRMRTGNWNTSDFEQFLEANDLESMDELLQGDFEIWRYRGVDGDDPSSVGTPTRTPWTRGTTGSEFVLDADGNPIINNADEIIRRRRTWTDIPEPPSGGQ